MAHKKSILIVDDAKINRALLRKMLSSRYQILEAENGQQALEQLMMPGNEIDAIVLDLIMPVMDGYAFLRAVRGNAKLCAMPILVTTQTNDEESEIHALECGATDFIAKPYKPAIVMQRIANLLVLSEAAALRNTTERDATTGSYNRQTFFRKVAEMLALRPEEQWDILCLDIEHFKIVNDLFGTAQGDHLLHFLADMIQMHAGQDALCGRLNGDNFAMLIPHCEGAIE
ncbi:MAG: response regulator, partial [Pygmaiobacter sp.]